MILNPNAQLSRRQAAQVLGWVQRGGRVVLATEDVSGSPLLQALGVVLVLAANQDVRVSQPFLLAPPVARVDGLASIVIAGYARNGAALSTNGGQVLAPERRGAGLVWVLTAPELLDNAHLARADNRRLLLNLVGNPGSVVAFDEASPAAASQSAPTNWLTDTAWGIALLFALAVLVLYRWLSGWRLGPPVVRLQDRHRLASEYVVSVAGLLQRAHQRADVLQIYQQGLRRSLAERFGASDIRQVEAAGGAELAPLLEPPHSLSEEQLRQRVADIVECDERLRRVRV
jgi:hypothetical protein